jgi:hypothetical protein
MLSVLRCSPYSDVLHTPRFSAPGHGRGEVADWVVIDWDKTLRGYNESLGYDGTRIPQKVNALAFK